MRTAEKKRGISLLEIIIVIALSAVVMVTIGAFILSVSRAEAKQEDVTTLMTELEDAKALAKRWMSGFADRSFRFEEGGDGVVNAVETTDAGESRYSLSMRDGVVSAWTKNGEIRLECTQISGMTAHYDEEYGVIQITFSYGDNQTAAIYMTPRVQ